MTALPDAPPLRSADWDEFRREMPVAGRWAYFDHAAVAPLSGPAQQALACWSEDAASNGTAANYRDWMNQIEELRRRAGDLIGADADEIALVPNTTSGVSLVAEGFPWRPGDNVVLPANEFPSNQYPWMNVADRGVEIRRVRDDNGRVPIERLADACDRRTRVVAVSWVAFSSGWRQDLDRLAEMVHAHGAFLFLDAIQGLGAFPLDVADTPVDFLAADGHKWLLGPEGAGVFFLRREHLDMLRPFGLGWHSVVHQSDFNRIELALKPTAARYEGGSANVPGLLALGASVALLSRFGIEAIGRRVLETTDLACRRLESIGAAVHSDRSPARQRDCCFLLARPRPGRGPPLLPQSRRRAQLPRGRLRISPHAYNNAADVDRLIEALQEAPKS